MAKSKHLLLEVDLGVIRQRNEILGIFIQRADLATFDVVHPAMQAHGVVAQTNGN